MSLAEYKKKRDLEKSPEPKGDMKKSKEKELIFVVHRHKASRLHYDLRLESKGVLKSWAIPKGPSMNPKDKRLAMMVDDHPYDYKDFEGIIPEGTYGAGIVEIWDKGTYKTLTPDKKKLSKADNLSKFLKKGEIKIIVDGEKLKGEFGLIKIRQRDDNSWLLVKGNDEHAVHKKYDSENHTPENSPINKELKKKNKKQD